MSIKVGACSKLFNVLKVFLYKSGKPGIVWFCFSHHHSTIEDWSTLTAPIVAAQLLCFAPCLRHSKERDFSSERGFRRRNYATFDCSSQSQSRCSIVKTCFKRKYKSNGIWLKTKRVIYAIILEPSNHITIGILLPLWKVDYHMVRPVGSKKTFGS